MNDQKRTALVNNAWTLYKLSMDMQKNMNEMFIDEFIDLDLEEQKRCLNGGNLPKDL